MSHFILQFIDRINKRYYSIDTQHGRFEMFDKKGKHLGETDIDLKPISNSNDLSGGHDIKVK